MGVDLGDYGMYHVKGLRSISFSMPSSDLELNDALFVPSLKKDILLVSCMEVHYCRIAFEG
jgi:hypothetical protein